MTESSTTQERGLVDDTSSFSLVQYPYKVAGDVFPRISFTELKESTIMLPSI